MWGEIDGEVTPEKLLERRNRQRGATRGERLVLELLADGARRAAGTEAAATEAGIPARTLYRSAHSLGVNRDRIGFGGEVWWSLPAQEWPPRAGAGRHEWQEWQEPRTR